MNTNRLTLLLATAACLTLAACSKTSDAPGTATPGATTPQGTQDSPAQTPGAAATAPEGAANAPQASRPMAPKDLPVGAHVPGQAPTVVKLSDGTMVDLASLKAMPGARPVENAVGVEAPAPESTRSLGGPEAPSKDDTAKKAGKAGAAAEPSPAKR